MDLIVVHVVLVEFVIVIVEWVVVMSKFLDGIGGDGIVAIVWFSLLVTMKGWRIVSHVWFLEKPEEKSIVDS